MGQITTPDYTKDAVLLLIRIIVGFSFLVAARNKSKNIKKFAAKNGLPVPMAIVVMCAEFTAGALLVLGIWPQIVAGVLMILMLGTIRLHIFKWHSPYWASAGGWEYDLMLLVLASVIFIFGAGKYTF